MNRAMHAYLWAVLLGANVLVGQTPPAAAPAASALAPRAVHRHESGLGIRVPFGWTAEDNPQGIALLPPGVRIDPDRNDNPEIYVAQVVGGYNPDEEAASIEQLGAAFMQSGVPMQREGEREGFEIRGRSGSVYTWEFRSPETGQQVAVRFYIAPQQTQAFLIVAAGETARLYGRDAALREAAVSMDVQAPPAVTMPEPGSPLTDNTPLAQQWLQKLRGRVIRQFIGGGGMTGERSRFLAADGTYTMQGSSVAAIDVGPYGEAPTASASSINREGMTGRWRLREQQGQVFLQIFSSDGQVFTLPITWDDRNWYLDGVKSFAVDP